MHVKSLWSGLRAGLALSVGGLSLSAWAQPSMPVEPQGGPAQGSFIAALPDPEPVSYPTPVSNIPEPEGVALALVGVGVVAWASRRRK